MTNSRSVLLFAAIATCLLLESHAFTTSPLRSSIQSHRFLAAESEQEEIKPDILLPFPPAADPKYAVTGVVGDKEFVLSRSGEPTAEELANENILKIVKIECSDLEVRRRHV